MTDHHPITPPPELVQQWMSEYINTKPSCAGPELIANRAAQWGADHELEACCTVLDGLAYEEAIGRDQLRAARRPKPPSLKEQAMEQLACIQTDLNKFGMGISTNTIRAALEALPND